MIDVTDARGVLRRRLLVVGALVVLITLAGCAADYQYRDRFDYATQHEDVGAAPAGEYNTSVNATHVNGQIEVYQNTSENQSVDLLVELRKVNSSEDSDGNFSYPVGYSALSDTVHVSKNKTVRVGYSVPHWGPGEYIVTVAGWPYQVKLTVPSNNSTMQRHPDVLEDKYTDENGSVELVTTHNVSDSDPEVIEG